MTIIAQTTPLTPMLVPGVRILQAIPGIRYLTSHLPSTVSRATIEWHHQGLDEAYHVILHRAAAGAPRRIEVVRGLWNQETQAWENRTVEDPTGLDLTVYLP